MSEMWKILPPSKENVDFLKKSYSLGSEGNHIVVSGS